MGKILMLKTVQLQAILKTTAQSKWGVETQRSFKKWKSNLPFGLDM